MIYIINFTISRDPADIEYYFYNGKKSNIDYLLDGFKEGTTEWSGPKNAKPGDIVVFLCGKNSRSNLGSAAAHVSNDYGQDFYDFIEQQKAVYKQYSGYLLGCGVVNSMPEYDSYTNWWYITINQLAEFTNPISIDEFKSFIHINSFGSVTYLKDEQWERLKWVVNQKNTDFFRDIIVPDVETIDEEFEKAVKKEESKPLDQLEKAAKKNASKPVVSVVQTKTYHRDPTIAAYVKKRANGVCQLCGQKAPFNDENGEPYLECHHIDWLSKGGMDSIDNCVALCPNCHRKMHVLNTPEDILELLKVIS